MMAWAWLGWITITLLLFASLFYAVKTKRWNVQVPVAWELTKPPTPEFTIDGEERGTRPQMGTREDTGKAKAVPEGGVDRESYEYERWKRAVTWLQEENPQFAKDPKESTNGPSAPPSR